MSIDFKNTILRKHATTKSTEGNEQNQKFIKIAHSCINIIASETPDVTLVICVMMQTSTKRNLLRLKKIITYVCSDPVWLYFRPSIVSYFAAAERSDQ